MIRTNRAIFVRQFQESTLLISKSRYSASFVTFPNPSTETITSQHIYVNEGTRHPLTPEGDKIWRIPATQSKATGTTPFA